MPLYAPFAGKPAHHVDRGTEGVLYCVPGPDSIFFAWFDLQLWPRSRSRSDLYSPTAREWVTEPAAAQITRLLHQWQSGHADAFARLVPLVYPELRTIASRHLAREWRHDRLQTTAVVNEAYLKLFGQRDVDWHDRGHFFAIAAKLMRRIVVDHARHVRRDKRGGGSMPIALNEEIPAPANAIDAVDALDLDRALVKLEALDPDQARIVELRFFGGLTVEETAAAVQISPATVKREWAIAKGWLYRELTGGAPPAD